MIGLPEESLAIPGETNGGVHDSGHVKMNGRMIHEPASSSRMEGENSSSGTVMPEEAALHPSSWPPPSQRNLMSHVSTSIALLCAQTTAAGDVPGRPNRAADIMLGTRETGRRALRAAWGRRNRVEKARLDPAWAFVIRRRA